MNSNYVFYTDGAYSSSRKQGGSSFVCLKNGECILEWSRTWKKGTSNTAEMLAILFAMLSVKDDIDSFMLYSDSMYCIGTLTLGWKRNKNKELWKVMDDALNKLREHCNVIEFRHVKGHNGDEWNTRCDTLAVKASQKIIDK